MIKVIYDTDVYIDWMQGKIQNGLIFREGEFIFISSIVIMELRVGVFTTKAVSAIEKLFKTAIKTDRLVVPNAQDYFKAGGILNDLRVKMGYNIKGASYITNDVLIALTARRIGAILRTFNKTDYKTINLFLDFQWELMPLM
jgi:predicted nucleic acid-binding protein